MFNEYKLHKKFKVRIEKKIFNKEQLISGFSSEEIKIMNFKWVLLK